MADDEKFVDLYPNATEIRVEDSPRKTINISLDYVKYGDTTVWIQSEIPPVQIRAFSNGFNNGFN